MKFKAGDRVRCVGGRWFDDLNSKTGTVIRYNPYAEYEIGIKFDKKIKNNNGHNLDGALDDYDKAYGYYIDEDDLELEKNNNKGAYM